MGLRGTNQEFGRPYNRRIVLEMIRLHGPISRVEIARRIALSLQTVSTIVREFEDLGLVLSERAVPKGRGQPALRLIINPDGGFAIGLQLVHDRIKAILVDLTGGVRSHREVALRDNTPSVALPLMAELVRNLVNLHGHNRVLGVGLVMPGPFDVETMSFIGPTTLHGWEGVPITDRLTELTGLPTFLGVDSSAAALGEKLHGIGRSLEDFYYIYFGVGLGGGAVLDGHPFTGSWGNAGEFGHLPVVIDGRPCTCGNQGCLETYVSYHALSEALRAEGLDAETDLIRLCEESHPALVAWIEQNVPLLRRAICMVENLFDPQCVVLGGLLPQPLLERICEALEPLLPSVSRRTGRQSPRLLLSSLGADSALHGAAVLALSGTMSPRFGQLFAVAEDDTEEASVTGLLGNKRQGPRVAAGTFTDFGGAS